MISRDGCFKGANTDKSPHLPPRIPASEAADNSSVSATLMEDFLRWSTAAGMEFERKQLHLAQATAHTPDGKVAADNNEQMKGWLLEKGRSHLDTQCF